MKIGQGLVVRTQDADSAALVTAVLSDGRVNAVVFVDGVTVPRSIGGLTVTEMRPLAPSPWSSAWAPDAEQEQEPPVDDTP